MGGTVTDHHFELRLDGREPARFATLQGAMAQGVLNPCAAGGIWYVGAAGTGPVMLVRYRTNGSPVLVQRL